MAAKYKATTTFDCGGKHGSCNKGDVFKGSADDVEMLLEKGLLEPVGEVKASDDADKKSTKAKG